LHTQQNVELEADKKKSYRAYFDTMDEKIIQLGTKEIPDLQFADHGDAQYALGLSNIPYQKYVSWEGYPQRFDIYSVDVKSGEATLAIKDLRGDAAISAEGEYLFWYNAEDTTWYSFSNVDKKANALTKSIATSMADELNDQPNFPYQYGFAGWASGDKNLLIYDRYDVWKVDPKNSVSPINLTKGRVTKTVYRVEDLDREEDALNPDFIIFHAFNETNKKEGYTSMKDFGRLKTLIGADAKFSSFSKAENASRVTFTKSNHQEYPDISATDLTFKKISKISNANPQQKDYAWGTVELYSWTSLDSLPLQGVLYKPANFDPTKKYPMIVNFYERHSDDLHDHWGVKPHRSTINAAFYASRGYLIFNPDVVYKEGYPGESAYNSIVSGTTALIKEGFVKEDKIGLQGHSWGGYQIAYLVTKTNLFACAEAGAVVSNMISAYGGIRWGTGLSRMFQYEHTQSRIGGTLWEYPKRYIENSPIFYADKVDTPLLLLHNDADGHVPWYQGIEYYVALRRLGKPVWMLNYNGEPHWPTKWENIRDFNIRMSQFFDYYLKDAPMPEWMGEGVPATEKGINKGLELNDKN
jgi:dipeptidyl aminopeptidase/acylaminoacyl peptidase